jgi:hypothetical protein
VLREMAACGDALGWRLSSARRCDYCLSHMCVSVRHEIMTDLPLQGFPISVPLTNYQNWECDAGANGICVNQADLDGLRKLELTVVCEDSVVEPGSTASEPVILGRYWLDLLVTLPQPSGSAAPCNNEELEAFELRTA